ncbi:MAG TPA: hypothetical protein VGA78_07645, partial [Gemmatimonadales bacterium]
MWSSLSSSRVRYSLPAILLALSPALAASQTLPALAASQSVPSRASGADSVVIAAGARHQAGGLHRFFFGSNYRDLWTTPVMVPVLDLHSFAGGLRPLEAGGGKQTKSLRFITPEGVEYVFRGVDKANEWNPPPRFKGTVVATISSDQVSTSHPAAALVVAPLLEAAGVLHATPAFVIMPDDPLLGEFRADFAGRLGIIEQYPSKPEHAAGFAGAVEIIDSEELRQLLDSDPRQRVDARAMLAARLMDMLLNDWDRHPGQWKWGRLQSSPRTAWVPIPRDRDKAFASYRGVIGTLARLAAPTLMLFEGRYPSLRGLTWNSLELDRRVLGGLARPVWDSVTGELVRRVTDSVIDAAVQAMPPEYQRAGPLLASKLKLRRDLLPGAANRFYRLLVAVADIHATDTADRATVTRVDDRFVDVRVESEGGTPSFLRRFDGQETGEIRVYLHGGDDSALVTGNVQHSIPVRIIGGNGTNRLLDSSRVRGRGHPARLYDVGRVNGVGYGPDTLYNRRPWVKEKGELVSPGPDRGGGFAPILGVSLEG